MDVRNLFMADAEPQDLSAPRGGLAPTMVGGLSKFVGNVTKGIEKVMSHPLYARAWSGAVSGMAGDPMAGPRALAELRAQNAPSLEDELNRYRLRKAQRDDEQAAREAEARDRLRQSFASGDQRSIEAEYAQAYPQQAAERLLAPPKTPKLQPIMTPDGPRLVPADQAVGQTPFSPSLVNINNTDPNLTRLQQYQLEEGMRADYETKSEPFVKINSSIANFDELLAEVERDPSALASQSATYKFQRALDDAAVMESDVKRILGTNYTNVLRGWVNAPQLATREQLIEMRGLLEQARRVAARRQRQVDDQFRSLVEIRQLNPVGVMPGGGYSAGFTFDSPTDDPSVTGGNVLSPERARELGLE